jgi:hypothetical protein
MHVMAAEFSLVNFFLPLLRSFTHLFKQQKQSLHHNPSIVYSSISWKEERDADIYLGFGEAT